MVFSGVFSSGIPIVLEYGVEKELFYSLRDGWNYEEIWCKYLGILYD